MKIKFNHEIELKGDNLSFIHVKFNSNEGIKNFLEDLLVRDEKHLCDTDIEELEIKYEYTDYEGYSLQVISNDTELNDSLHDVISGYRQCFRDIMEETINNGYDGDIQEITEYKIEKYYTSIVFVSDIITININDALYKNISISFRISEEIITK